MISKNKKKTSSALRKPSYKMNWRIIRKALSSPKSVIFVGNKAVFSDAFIAVAIGPKQEFKIGMTGFGKTSAPAPLPERALR